MAVNIVSMFLHSLWQTFVFAQKTVCSQKFNDFAGKCKTGDEVEKKNWNLMLLWENAKFISKNQYFCVSPKNICKLICIV